MQKTIIASFMIDELEKTNRISGTSFASPYEGYAVMLEEMHELFEEIRRKNPDEERMRTQAIRVGAITIKFIMSLERWFGSKRSSESSQCRLCLYNVMTADELADLGYDPCLACEHLSNWKTNPDWDTCDDCGGAVRIGQCNDFFLERGDYGIPKEHHSKLVCKHCYETKYAGGENE